MLRVVPSRLPASLLVSCCPSLLAPTGPAAPVCAAFRTPGRSVGTQRLSAPAPVSGGRSRQTHTPVLQAETDLPMQAAACAPHYAQMELKASELCQERRS